MNYPQIMSPAPLPLKVGVMSPSSYGSAAHTPNPREQIHTFLGCFTRLQSAHPS